MTPVTRPVISNWQVNHIWGGHSELECFHNCTSLQSTIRPKITNLQKCWPDEKKINLQRLFDRIFSLRIDP